MRRSFRRSSIPRGSRPVRPVDWSSKNFSTTSAVSLTNSGFKTADWVITPDAVSRNYVDPTWMRAIIFAAVRNVGSPSAGFLDSTGRAHSAVGLGLIKWQGVPVPNASEDIVSQIGEATLPAQFPDPIGDANLDWIWRFVAGYPPGIAAGTIVYNHGSDLAVESLAKRRLGNDSGVLMVASNWSLSDASFTLDIRYLIKE